MTAPVDVAKLRADIAYDEAQGNDVDSAMEPCLDEIERLRAALTETLAFEPPDFTLALNQRPDERGVP